MMRRLLTQIAVGAAAYTATAAGIIEILEIIDPIIPDVIP